MDSAFFNEVAKKWQEKWENNKVFEANPSNSEKYFITVAFPYTNSPLHIGHGRTYITADIVARYQRMIGKNVLFPFAFQFTGTPILSISESIKRGDSDIISDFINLYKISPEKVREFEDPLKLAEYFKEDMKRMAKALGLSVDWRREFTTIDPRFGQFIKWQFRKLKEKGFITTATDAVGYCPNDNFPVGMHDTKGDVEPEVQEMDVIEFEGNDVVFPTATSRPETVFGANAVLINPEATYVLIRGSNWVLSKEAFRKLSYQRELVPEREVQGKDLIGLTVKNPISGKDVKVYGSKFVDAKMGTGSVMAVPAHEPLHYLGLSEVLSEVEVIPVISTEGYGDFPGPEVLALAGTKNPAELKDYIDTLYREEYYKGVMREDIVDLVPDYMRSIVKDRIAGKRVPEARRETVELLRSLGKHDLIYEISNGPIYCRCGAEIVVKVIRDQWYITYDNPLWKSWTMKALDRISIVPEEARRDMAKAIFSMKRRACSRSRGLGVKLPWDESQIIDSLSDSTIYTGFYTVAHKLSHDPSKLNDQFWDFVLLGNGDASEVSKVTGISVEELKDLRNEFSYWYPLDSRHSGRDLVQNHLPFLIYNHLAIFGESLLPRQIVINGFVRVGGKKMSKSFRNIYPLYKAVEEYGVDPVRLALTISSELLEDTDFDVNTVKAVTDQLRRMYDLAVNLSKLRENESTGLPEKWLLSIIHYKVKEVSDLMNSLDLRKAFNIILYEYYEILRDYLSMVSNPNTSVLRKAIEIWARLISPGAPHIAEEIWHIFNEGFVSLTRYPVPEELEVDGQAVIQLEYIRHLINQVKEISSMANKQPEKLIIYVSNSDELGILRAVLRGLKERKNLRELSSITGQREEYLRSLVERVQSLPPILRELIVTYPLDEFKTITDNLNFLVRRLDVDEIQVYRSDEANAPDIKGKKSNALPLLPGIVII
ncbi:leucyl-tRNA synthetase [Metallosphaera sedula]|uniref:Leucine--tRNA ligase 1 n=5 Tax=Metallosphaera TaxID=41980 RepID=SYL1_METS5|nr:MULTISPECIES: leucine--tRNA ligase [Metallosphaera]A4YE96.1 RecName: Full=Leucine--tRNA ligase 1; AltName: Full=Leucyl-tRNA synthetase 1; Short=LeuRS 1 [Metallosphaera sedula DSM 5348]ABP94748.1 leucyl-tRNA synthetase [Metallosphaera sedula DSM 5348]AIM26735.1 leucyl-tRNA synthetase [Metallosphaera sedula]AKV73691.1 leucyl-tRNA synthetase [Metallosphaera sedula]AKV75931.1 leucyl-tRNA synthetase [Metallosphaera sedula]AKV78182.1 leucyl-tRNA synthetase [Metallosphaera sedula]